MGHRLTALHIALVGLPGSGKSTVGRQLARRLGLPFQDTDHAIELRLGCSIRDYFERQGEDAFRQLEAEVLAQISLGPRCVLSTGGGAVLRPENRQRLRCLAQVVYLRAQPEDIFRRLRHDRSRPLLQVVDPLQRLRDLFVQRDPLYRETAHHVLETGRPSVAMLVSKITMQIELSALDGAHGPDALGRAAQFPEPVATLGAKADSATVRPA